MALQIEKPSPFGVSAKYWRIVFYQYDLDKPEFVCVLHAYIDEQARCNGSKPLMEVHFTVRRERNGNEHTVKMYFGNETTMEGDTFVFPAEIDRIYLYDLLRNEVPFFTGADDA